MNNLKTYSFKLKDSFFPQSFSGTIQAESIQQANDNIKEEYAANLGTTEEDITITELMEVSN